MTVRLVSLGAPARSKGLVKGRLVFVIVAPFAVSMTRGVELIITCLDVLSDTLGELANGHVQVESGSIFCDRVGIALMWHSTAL